MDALDPVVGDRMIYGKGTSREQWLEDGQLHLCSALKIHDFFRPQQRICIVAPHPDDEILGCGGLIQQLDAAGFEIVIIAVTNGTASHPQSQIYHPTDLNKIRPLESKNAWQSLDLKQPLQRIALELQDGQVAQQQNQLKTQLLAIMQPNDVFVCTFEHDGHPDHEVTGQVVKEIANTQHRPYLQVLIWAWHWAIPQDTRIPWQSALRLDLSEAQLQRKAEAIQCFQSQINADESIPQAAILSTDAIQRILQPWEVYLNENGL